VGVSACYFERTPDGSVPEGSDLPIRVVVESENISPPGIYKRFSYFSRHDAKALLSSLVEALGDATAYEDRIASKAADWIEEECARQSRMGGLDEDERVTITVTGDVLADGIRAGEWRK
jgi:hypothetical protein